MLRSDRLAFAFGGAGNFVLPLELVHTARGVDQLLTAGEERVAVGAKFDADVALVSGTGFEHDATSANYVELIISGVDASFHFEKGTFRKLPV